MSEEGKRCLRSKGGDLRGVPQEANLQGTSPGLGFRPCGRRCGCSALDGQEARWPAQTRSRPQPRGKEEAPCRVQVGGDVEGASALVETRGVYTVHTGRAKGGSYQPGLELSCRWGPQILVSRPEPTITSRSQMCTVTKGAAAGSSQTPSSRPRCLPTALYWGMLTSCSILAEKCRKEHHALSQSRCWRIDLKLRGDTLITITESKKSYWKILV